MASKNKKTGIKRLQYRLVSNQRDLNDVIDKLREHYEDEFIHSKIISGHIPVTIDDQLVVFDDIPGYKLQWKEDPPKDITVCGDVEKNPGPVKQNTQKKAQKMATKDAGKKNNNARTIGKVEKTLINVNKGVVSKKVVQPGIDMSYLTCRLDPFRGSGSKGLPDGSNIKRFVIDHAGFTDINVLGSCTGFTLHLVPNVSTPITIIPIDSGGASSLKITTGNNNYNVNAVFSNNGVAIAAGTYSEFNNAFPFTHPGSGEKSRFITMGMKIIYTGPANTAQGLINCRDAPTEYGYERLAPGTVNGYTAEANTTQNYMTGTNSKAISLDTPYGTSITTMPKDTKTFRPEEGAVMLAKHNTSVYRWIDWQSAGAALTLPSAAYSLISTTQNWTYSGGNGPAPLLVNYDADWSSPEMVVSGVNSTCSFRVYYTHCVEYDCSPGSLFSKIVTNPPPANAAAIAIADAVQSNSPVATTARDSGSWVNTAIKLIKASAKVASKIPHPIVSAIGTAASEMFD
jgi:sporulation protein YlmC with PRC-barrel domain/uncharacterized protein YkuJ